MQHKYKKSGFTLMEVLIALFIFTVLSMILVGALRNVINTETRSERTAAQLRQLQMSLLVLSRDVEQVVDRPVLNASSKEEAAFVGSPTSMTFTHMGYANSISSFKTSTLQRVRYAWKDNALWRTSWVRLDITKETKSSTRALLSDIGEIRFQYLDKNNRFLDNWPSVGKNDQPLPRAVRMYLTIPKWGTMSQLYVISTQAKSPEAQNSSVSSPQAAPSNNPNTTGAPNAVPPSSNP